MPELVATDDVLSEDEQADLIALARAIGLDIGEMDVLRDRGDGRIYPVDINRTCYGPPNHLPEQDGDRAMEMLAAAFETEFLAVKTAPIIQAGP